MPHFCKHGSYSNARNYRTFAPKKIRKLAMRYHGRRMWGRKVGEVEYKGWGWLKRCLCISLECKLNKTLVFKLKLERTVPHLFASRNNIKDRKMHFFLAVCSYANYDLLPTQSLLHTLPDENCPYDVTSRRPLVCHASIGPSDLVALVLDQVGDVWLLQSWALYLWSWNFLGSRHQVGTKI